MDLDDAITAASSRDWSTRAAAASLLAGSDDPEVEAMTRSLLGDENTAVIEAAARALLLRGDRRGVELFCDAYADPADDHVADHLNDVLMIIKFERPETFDVLQSLAQGGRAGAQEALQWLGSQ